MFCEFIDLHNDLGAASVRQKIDLLNPLHISHSPQAYWLDERSASLADIKEHEGSKNHSVKAMGYLLCL